MPPSPEAARSLPDGQSSLVRLNPAWFALVMATGIVSVAAKLAGLAVVPIVLMWVAVASYGVLWILYLARLAMHRREFLADFADHLRGMGYFTIVAATTVLGSALIIVGEAPHVSKWLWVVGVGFWFVLVYAIPVSQMLLEPEPKFSAGLTGTWLVWVVATQGVSLLASLVASQFGAQAENIVLFALLLWLLGLVIYIWVMALLLGRLLFGALEPGQLSPTYWITMGAEAISTLAGALLLDEAAGYPITSDLLGFIKGFTLLLWAVASWWIPWLVIMGVWRHVARRYPLSFDPGWWGMVFPMGMYTVATYKLAGAIDYPGLARIADVFVWIALGAWLATVVNMVITLSRRPLPQNAI